MTTKEIVCFKCGKNTHICTKCPDKDTILNYPFAPRKPKNDVPAIKKPNLCWKCGSTTHWSGDCPDKENIMGWPHRPKI